MTEVLLGTCEAEAPPDGEDAWDDGGEDVEEAEGSVATSHEGQAVVGEGGEGGEASQKSHDEEGPKPFGDALGGLAGGESDEKAAQEITSKNT